MATTSEPVVYEYLKPKQPDTVPKERFTPRQTEAIEAMSRGASLEAFKDITIRILGERGYHAVSDALWSPMTEKAMAIMPLDAMHPRAKEIIQLLIDEGPQDVYQDKWPHWPIVGAAHKRGEISLKVEPRGGFGSNVVRVTLAWRDSQ